MKTLSMRSTATSAAKQLERPHSVNKESQAMKKMKLKAKEKGFTLIEVLVVLAILGAITGVMSMTITMIMRISPQSNDRAIVLRQVQNAGHWISRDVLMAQTVTPEPVSGTLLSLEWDDWEGNHYVVDYVFDGNTLKRQLNGAPGILIAEYIVVDDTSFEMDDEADNEYKLIIKASHGEAEVERSYEISQRAPSG